MSYLTVFILALAVYGAVHSVKDVWPLVKAGWTKLKALFVKTPPSV